MCTVSSFYLPFPGTYISGPYFGNIVIPMPGDLIFYRWKSMTEGAYGSDPMNTDHVGIVRGCNNGVIYTVEGNVSFNGVKSRCNTCQYSISDSRISGYVRPNWGAVGGSYEGLHTISMNNSNGSNAIYSATSTGPSRHSTSSHSSTPVNNTPATAPATEVETAILEPAKLISKSLYDTINSAEDAILREVGYLSTSGTKNLSNGLKLSVINYTGILSEIVRISQSAVYYFEDLSFDTDLLRHPTDKVVMRYLFDKGFNAPQAVGIYSVIYKISECDSSFISVDKTKYGILGWNKAEMENVIRFCGLDWTNTLTRQLDYFWTDMCSNHKGYIESMENEVLENKKSYVRQSVELTVKEYAKGYPKSFEDSCKNIALQTWEILQGE
jgi:hypothetical protein